MNSLLLHGKKCNKLLDYWMNDCRPGRGWAWTEKLSQSRKGLWDCIEQQWRWECKLPSLPRGSHLSLSPPATGDQRNRKNTDEQLARYSFMAPSREWHHWKEVIILLIPKPGCSFYLLKPSIWISKIEDLGVTFWVDGTVLHLHCVLLYVFYYLKLRKINIIWGGKKWQLSMYNMIQLCKTFKIYITIECVFFKCINN